MGNGKYEYERSRVYRVRMKVCKEGQICLLITSLVAFLSCFYAYLLPSFLFCIVLLILMLAQSFYVEVLDANASKEEC